MPRPRRNDGWSRVIRAWPRWATYVEALPRATYDVMPESAEEPTSSTSASVGGLLVAREAA